MSGVFQKMQGGIDSLARLDPIGAKALAKVDPGGNALGVYGSNAPKPLFGDKVAEGMGIYGADTAEYDKQTYENERVKALQQGETDMASVNKRTSQMLAGEGLGKRTTGMTLLGG